MQLENWLKSTEFDQDKKKYETTVDAEVKNLVSQIFKNETYFIHWYTQEKPKELNGKTPYEHTLKQGLKYVKKTLNGLMNPPAT
ncbi:hypothetical protein COV11_02985 [Candidatus Woesearchaeota archaeon CG10_big_fil_rev_8_21_14_0_10_30_7]|nr:MAG: hypothetical protein COV11_02985 [Candidatus Woesearchaeota archaeon CG10_big_fil_rev_8_21_14_0_10_30_7]